jgi:hypothetical protein
MQEKLNRRILLLKNASPIKLKCPKAFGLLGHLIKIVLSVCLLDRLCFSSDEKSLLGIFVKDVLNTNNRQYVFRRI